MDEFSAYDEIVLIHGISTDPKELLSKFIKELFEHGSYPPVDISLRNDTLIVWIELAGVKKENVKIYLYEDLLIIEGIVRPEKADKYKFIRVERASNPFRRIIKLPVRVDPRNIEAIFNEGVFKIVFKRTPKELIKIRVNDDGGKSGTAN